MSTCQIWMVTDWACWPLSCQRSSFLSDREPDSLLKSLYSLHWILSSRLIRLILRFSPPRASARWPPALSWSAVLVIDTVDMQRELLQVGFTDFMCKGVFSELICLQPCLNMWWLRLFACSKLENKKRQRSLVPSLKIFLDFFPFIDLNSELSERY